MLLAVGTCEGLFAILIGASSRLVDSFLEQCEELFRELNAKQDVAFFNVSVSFTVSSSACKTRNLSKSSGRRTSIHYTSLKHCMGTSTEQLIGYSSFTFANIFKKINCKGKFRKGLVPILCKVLRFRIVRKSTPDIVRHSVVTLSQSWKFLCELKVIFLNLSFVDTLCSFFLNKSKKCAQNCYLPYNLS